ncbi:MAG: tol-pal system-associated acyl-CoA thioesterase [Gammaproteobacteria bacterium]|nr:tol-pal system-associated acyl-CoA thioesterase [Gammaproteobacteria bacterium]MBI5617147.1 tol-pal system-associated acyl-CoA thioesterase [Gammaproteobacteria bacterium]
MTGKRAEFCWPVRVYYEDTDAAGIVYHANYLKFMERGRTEWLRALGYEQDALVAEFGVVFVIRNATLEFIAPARFNDELVVKTSILSIGRATMEFLQVVADAAGRALCSAEVRVGCVDVSRMVPRRMPPELFSRIRDGS